MLPVGRDRIRTLRAVGPLRDPLALRLAVERTLAAADLHPTGLPHDAIVCVRRLRMDAAPGMPGWSRRVEREVQSLLPRAARPFRGPVPESALAVVFFDHAELIACLARDWLRGDGHAWWWRSLFGRPLSDGLVRGVLLEAAVVVPAAMDRLLEAGLALEAVGAMSDSSCEQVAAAVAAAFAMPGWPTWPRAAAGQAPPGSAPAAAGATAEAGTTVARMLDRVPRPAGLGRLSPPQRALFATALTLQRAPTLARTPEFVAALRGDTWWEMPDPVVHEEPRSEPASSLVGISPLDDALPAPGRERWGKRAREPAVPGLAADPGPSSPEPRTWQVPTRVPSAVPLAASELRTVVRSEFAGVLYLVNLALHLELYGDFTQPARPGLALPLGDFLALVGHETCGAAFREDPLWALLARIADREPDDPPAAGSMPAVLESGWLSNLLVLLEARAALGLGMPEGGGLRLLCARAGQVALSPTRLDAFYPLVAHPLAIRMSGLDRNPGWVPAAGRVIEFHYV